jgi:hypothetical protein
MPVIGRLDKQVSEVLIDPIGGRVRRDAGEEPAPPDPTRPPTPDPPGSDAARDAGQARHNEGAQTPRADAPLPVWLL